MVRRTSGTRSPKAVLYCRVSTGEHTTANQRAELEQLAATRGFGKKRLDAINLRDIDGFKAKQIAEGKSPKTSNNYLTALRRCLSGEIVAAAGARSTSVVVFRVQDTRTDRVIERLRDVLVQSSDAIADGASVVVKDAQHRVRRLPF